MWDYKLIKNPKGAFSTRSLAQDLFTLVNFGYLCCTATCAVAKTSFFRMIAIN